MASRVLAGVVSVSLLASCGSQSGQANKAESAQPNANPIDGYGDIKFAESFTELMAAHGAGFEPYDIRECYKNMPLAGCVLISRNATPPQVRDGIPYTLTARLNQQGKVTDVELQYERKGVISVGECRSIHERTLDWLVRDYGNLYEEITPKAAERFRTPAGNTYLDTAPGKDGNWVSSILRTGVRGADVHNNRYIELRTTYIIAKGEPHCQVSAEFSDAPSVSRPDPFRAMDIEFGNGGDGPSQNANDAGE
jgi:hypothetical protein